MAPIQLKAVDTIIVGQGLAGSILAMELLERETSVMLIDNNHEGSASQVAAGLINPITGHRFNLTHNFAEHNEAARAVYERITSLLGKPFYRKVEQFRLIKNAGQAHYFETRLDDPLYAPYLARADHHGILGSTSLYGVAEIFESAVVDAAALLASIKQYLHSRESIVQGKLDYSQIGFNDRVVEYQGIRAKRIVFCEGHQALHNPWLSALPFKLAKGEVLTVTDTTNKPFAGLLNWGNWLVGSSTGESAKLGSNFEWVWHEPAQTLSASGGLPTPLVAQKLVRSAQEHTNYSLTILNHEAGIRPTTKQRIPFIGPINNQRNSYCFNGFGSKGCLIIPAYSSLLCDHILDQTPLKEELTQWL